MPNLFVRVLLFVSSYAPLLVIFWLRDQFQPTASVALLGLALLSVGALILYLRLARQFSPHTVSVRSASGCSHEAISYILSYLLPFLGLDSGSSADRLSLALILGVIAVLYIGANLIHMNPVLNLLRYHIFELETTDGKHSVLISRRRYLRSESHLRVVSLANNVLLEI